MQDTFNYRDNFCYEYDQLMFDGMTPEEFLASRPEALVLSTHGTVGNKVTIKRPAPGKCGEWCWKTKLSKRNQITCREICVSSGKGNPALIFFVGGVIPKKVRSGNTHFQLFQRVKRQSSHPPKKDHPPMLNTEANPWIDGGSFVTFGGLNPGQAHHHPEKGETSSARPKANSANNYISEQEVTNVIVAKHLRPEDPIIARLSSSGAVEDVPQPVVIVKELRKDRWVPTIVTINPEESVSNYGDLLKSYTDAKIDVYSG